SASATAKERAPSRSTCSTAPPSSTGWRSRYSRISRARCRTRCASTAHRSASLPSQPLLRDALLCPRQPCLLDKVAQLVAVELAEVGDAHEHGRVAVPVRRREVDAAGVGEEHLLHAEIGNAEDEHVVEPLARVRIDGIRPPTPVEAEHLPVHLVDRAAVLEF